MFFLLAFSSLMLSALTSTTGFFTSTRFALLMFSSARYWSSYSSVASELGMSRCTEPAAGVPCEDGAKGFSKMGEALEKLTSDESSSP